MEHDVSVKALEARFLELDRRLERQEAGRGQLERRLEAWCQRLDADFATKNAVHALSAKLAIEVTAFRRDLDEGLEELRAESASREDLRALREEQAKGFRAVGEAAALAAEERAALATALCAADGRAEEVRAAVSGLQADLARLLRQAAGWDEGLARAQEALDAHGAEHSAAREERRELRQRHDAHELAATLAATGLAAVRADLTDLTRCCREELATAVHVEQLDVRIDSAVKASDAAVLCSRALASELEHERNLTRRTVHDHAGSFVEMRRLLDECLRASDAKGNVARRCEVLGSTLDALEARESRSSRAAAEAAEALKVQLGEMHADLLQSIRRVDLGLHETRQFAAKFCIQGLGEVAQQLAKA